VTAAVLVLAVLAGSAAGIAGWATDGRWGWLPLLVPRDWRASFRGRRRFVVVGQQVRRVKQESAKIGKRLRLIILAADRYQCVACGRRKGDPDGQGRPVKLCIDHMIPWRLGGVTCIWNCAVLCSQCNTVKGAYFRRADGSVYYRPWRGSSRRGATTAGRILDAELRARRSPGRWARALRAA
jgi:5-methylcytosine-specific restriction endonuclease McrA